MVNANWKLLAGIVAVCCVSSCFAMYVRHTYAIDVTPVYEEDEEDEADENQLGGLSW